MRSLSGLLLAVFLLGTMVSSAHAYRIDPWPLFDWPPEGKKPEVWVVSIEGEALLKVPVADDGSFNLGQLADVKPAQPKPLSWLFGNPACEGLPHDEPRVAPRDATGTLATIELHVEGDPTPFAYLEAQEIPSSLRESFFGVLMEPKDLYGRVYEVLGPPYTYLAWFSGNFRMEAVVSCLLAAERGVVVGHRKARSEWMIPTEVRTSVFGSPQKVNTGRYVSVTNAKLTNRLGPAWVPMVVSLDLDLETGQDALSLQLKWWFVEMNTPLRPVPVGCAGQECYREL